MSEQLRRMTTACGLSALLVACAMAAVDFRVALGAPWRGLAALGTLFVVASLVLHRGLLRWESSRRRTALHVKLIGESAAAVEQQLVVFNPCFVSRLSLERCGLHAVPPRVVQCFVGLSSLNLRGNRLTSIDELCGLTSLRMLNVSNNRLTALPVNLVNLRQLRHFNAGDNAGLSETFQFAESLRATQLLLREAAEYYARAPRAIAAIVALLCVKKRAGRDDSLWGRVPRDVVLLVARLLHHSRHDPAWSFRGKRKAI